MKHGPYFVYRGSELLSEHADHAEAIRAADAAGGTGGHAARVLDVAGDSVWRQLSIYNQVAYVVRAARRASLKHGSPERALELLQESLLRLERAPLALLISHAEETAIDHARVRRDFWRSVRLELQLLARLQRPFCGLCHDIDPFRCEQCMWDAS